MRALALLAVTLLSAPPPPAEHPVGWRGDGSGRFPEATPPTEWATAKNVRWNVVVGKGYASPIVVGDLVVVASEPGVLVALHRGDGKEKWKITVGPADLEDASARTLAASKA